MTSLYPPHFIGGAELSCQGHAELLEKRGHAVYILTSQWGLERRAVQGNVYRLLNYHHADPGAENRKDFGGPLRLRRRADQLRRAFTLRKNYDLARPVVAATQPDVAYVWHMQAVSITPVLAAQDLGVPIVIRLPDYWLAQMRTELCLEPNPLKRWYRAVFTGLGGFARLDTSHMLPNSGVVMQRYLEAGFAADSMQVLPNGLPSNLVPDADALPALPPSVQPGAIRLLFAGRLVSLKGPDIAIRALAHLIGQLGVGQARLDIIGEGPKEYVHELQDMVRVLGLEEKVSFVGRIDHSELLERYTEYDVLLLPSRWPEPFGRVMLEAMARGLPVVAANTGGTPEVISDGDNGLLVPPGEPLMLANAVKRLAQDPVLAHRIRYAALESVREKYVLERIVEQLESYLQMVLSKRVLPGWDQGN